MSDIRYTTDDIMAQFTQQEAWHSALSELTNSPEFRAMLDGELEIPDDALKDDAEATFPGGGGRQHLFPALNMNVDPGTVRLTAWRDASRWALILETVCHNMRGGGIRNYLHWFGNCIRPSGTEGNSNLHCIAPAEVDPNGTTYRDDDSGEFRLDRQTILLRGRATPVDLRAEALLAKQINPNADDYGLEPDGWALVLRALLPEHRDDLLASDEELRTFVPGDLPRLMQLHEWHHPDIAAGEKVGVSDTFRMIADAIAAGDSGLYRPNRPPNTHWSNWRQEIF